MSTNIQISVTSSYWDNPRPLRKMFNKFYLNTRDSEVNCFSSLVTSQLKWWFTSTPFSPSGTPITCKLYASWFLKGLWASAHFSSFLFLSVPQTDNFIWPIFEFASSLFCQLKADVQPSSEFFISVIVFSTPEFLFGSVLFLSLSIFNIWEDIILDFSSILLDMFSLVLWTYL